MTIKSIALTLPFVLVAWVAVMAAVMYLSDAAPAAVVILPDAGFVKRLPDGIAILSATDVSLTLKSDVPGFGAALYALGAKLVLPAGLTGCLPLPSQRPLKNAG